VIEAEGGDIGRLVARGVLAGAFAELSLVAFVVGNVVGDLEGRSGAPIGGALPLSALRAHKRTH
jgi:hypothetical protein